MTKYQMPFTIFNTIKLTATYGLTHWADLARLMALPIIIPTLLLVLSATARAYGVGGVSSFLHYLFLFINMATYVMFCVATHRHVSMAERGNIYQALAWNSQKSTYTLSLVAYVLFNALAFFVLVSSALSGSPLGTIGGLMIALITAVLTSLILPAGAVGNHVSIRPPMAMARDNFGKLLGVHFVFMALSMVVMMAFIRLSVAVTIAYLGDLPPAPATLSTMGDSVLVQYMQINTLGTTPVADGGLAGLPYLLFQLTHGVISHILIALYLIMVSLFYIRATEQGTPNHD